MIEKEKLPALLVKEAFHSFELGDEFPSSYLADLAFNSWNEKDDKITMKEMLKKACSFVNHQKRQGLIECADQKWSVNINGNLLKRKVYRKVGELSEWKMMCNQPIPEEYHDFAYIWNELDVGVSFTATQFHDHLDAEGIEVTYNGQVGKFLWLISDREFCECIKGNGPNSCIYTRIDSIPESVLEDNGDKFFSVRMGPYRSKLSKMFSK